MNRIATYFFTPLCTALGANDSHIQPLIRAIVASDMFHTK
jgi:hypothetical protein